MGYGDHVPAVVKHHYPSCTQHRSHAPNARLVEGDIEIVAGEETPGQSRHRHGSNRPAVGWSPRPVVEQRLQREADGNLVVSRPADVAGQADQLRSRMSVLPEAPVPLCAATQDVRYRCQRLDVVDDCGKVVVTVSDGVRGAIAGERMFALETVEHRSLFATDVRSGSPPQVDAEVKILPQYALAQVACRLRLTNRPLQNIHRFRILVSQIDEPTCRAARVCGDGHALDQPVGVVVEYRAILEATGLPLVGVAHDCLGFSGGLCHGLPLPTSRKTGTAAPCKLALGNDLCHFIGRHCYSALEPLVPGCLPITVDTCPALLTNRRKHALFHPAGIGWRHR